jgi:predicted CXXCH cytochrome family protein
MKITYLLLAGITLFLIAIPGGGAETMVEDQQRTFILPQIKRDCKRCHLSHHVTKGTALLKKPVAELCIECHKDRKWPNEHKVDIIPPLNVKQLPLYKGKITCITCHDVHQNPYEKLLRMPEKDLCINCHAQEVGAGDSKSRD